MTRNGFAALLVVAFCSQVLLAQPNVAPTPATVQKVNVEKNTLFVKVGAIEMLPIRIGPETQLFDATGNLEWKALKDAPSLERKEVLLTFDKSGKRTVVRRVQLAGP
jgi:hypothetical protein